MNAIKPSATLKWRNRTAQLEIGIAEQPPTNSQLELLRAAKSLHPDSTSRPNNTEAATPPFGPICPELSDNSGPKLPHELVRKSYLRVAPGDQQPPLLVSFIRSIRYKTLINRPAAKGVASKLPQSFLPVDQNERWLFVMEELTGPRWLEADMTPVHTAIARSTKPTARVVEALLSEASTRTRKGWLPEELKWLEQCTGSRAIIQQVHLFTSVESAVPESTLNPPKDLNTNQLNIVYGWWLESIIAAHDRPTGTCEHWVSLSEYLDTLELALTLAKNGFQVVAFGMGAVAITRPEPAQLNKVTEIALTNECQLLSGKEGRLPIPDSVTVEDLPEASRKTLIYNRLLTSSNTPQILRIALS